MTNNPLPAALASIKRYSIVYGGDNTQPRFVLVEDREGEVMKAADVLALPPPADGAVGYITERSLQDMRNRTRGDDPEGGWFIVGYEPDAAKTVALYAAPPADSAMERELKILCDKKSTMREIDESLERARALLAGRT